MLERKSPGSTSIQQAHREQPFGQRAGPLMRSRVCTVKWSKKKLEKRTPTFLSMQESLPRFCESHICRLVMEMLVPLHDNYWIPDTGGRAS